MNDHTKSRNIVFRAAGAIWRGLDGVRKATHLVLMLFVLMAFIGALSGSAPSLPKSSVLAIQPVGGLVEEVVGSPFDRASADLREQGRPQARFSDGVEALE